MNDTNGHAGAETRKTDVGPPGTAKPALGKDGKPAMSGDEQLAERRAAKAEAKAGANGRKP